VHQVFLSYASEDRPTAERLAAALMRHDILVWWDRHIPAGQRFDIVIQEALSDARCVVVLWSAHAGTSDWVRDEADDGRQRGILVPCRLDAFPIPLGFRGIQAIDFLEWGDSSTSPPFERLLASIKGILADPTKRPTVVPTTIAEDPSEVQQQSRKTKRWLIALGVLPFGALLGLAVGVTLDYAMSAPIGWSVSVMFGVWVATPIASVIAWRRLK